MTTAESTRPERAALNVMLAVAGLAAASVSWAHVAHWTMDTLHVGPWQGYTNSCVTELVPIASGLVIRAKRRTGIRYPAGPIATLATFGVFSLMAQVAEVPRTWQAWLLAALPCLGAAAVVKLVLAMPTLATTTAVPGQDMHIDLTTTPPMATVQPATPHGHLTAVPKQRLATREFDVAKLHQLLADQPTTSQVQAARILDVSRTTIRKYWPEPAKESVTA